MKYLWAALASLLMSTAGGAGAPALPGDSVYQLQVELTTQDGSARRLVEMRGHPVLIAMFYASCGGVCPTIAFTMRRMEAALTPGERDALRSVMVSFDPERDNREALAEFARVNKLEDPRWIVARTPEPTVRNLAAVLVVRYRKLPDQTFSHSTIIALLDADGVIRARTAKLSELDPDFMRTLSETIARGARP